MKLQHQFGNAVTSKVKLANKMAEDKRPRIADKCEHQYSKSMNQEYPRKCIKCGEPEISEEDLKSKLSSYVQYFSICKELDEKQLDKTQVESFHQDLYLLEQDCKDNLGVLIEYLKLK